MYKRKGFYDFYQQSKKIDFHHLRVSTFMGMLPHIGKEAKKGIDKIFPDIYNEAKNTVKDGAWLKAMHEKAKRIKLKSNAGI